MTRRLVLSSMLLCAGVSAAFAQNSLNDFVARCGGPNNVTSIGGGRLGCKSAPDMPSVPSMTGLGEIFADFLRGLDAAAARRTAELKARREAALQIVEQHRNAALGRQDAARAQLLQDIAHRVSRSEGLFKGFTGAGAQLGVKTQSAGGLQMKTGRAGFGSLERTEAPTAAPTEPAESPAQLEDLKDAFDQLPFSEQLEMLREMRARSRPPDDAREEALVDSVTEVRLTGIEPITFPEGMTPEQLSAAMEKTFTDQLGGGVLDILRASGPPPPDWVLNPDADPAVDPCEAAIAIDSSIVDLRCASEGLIDPERLRPVGRRHDTGTRAEPPSPIDRAWEREALDVLFGNQAGPPIRLPDDFDRLGSSTFKPGPVIERLATRGGGAIRPVDRMAVVLDLAPDKWAAYFTDPQLSRRLDTMIDLTVARSRWEHAELDVLQWRQGITSLYSEMLRYNANPDPAVLLTISPFVQKRDEISKRMADARAENARIAQFRLTVDLYDTLKAIK